MKDNCDNSAVLRFSDFDGALAVTWSSERPSPSSPAPNYNHMDPARKLEKRDVALIWLVTNGVQFFVPIPCPIDEGSPSATNDDEPRRVAPIASSESTLHPDLEPPLLIHLVRSQSVFNDVGTSPRNPLQHAIPSPHHHVSAIISRTVVKEAPTPPRGIVG
ncbi:hypothetical protein BS47DRAFT_1387992 [Hydnum rufescens UP504]|uniref:Uncharacterized protein n=1 Tax=Hydnum rufescens UP504 TaxID=1448309 RepID=A0A9P6B8L6_9AGAM|nr:hypothetical protein BS47DRAFT_1387992 [Hydnum rufescens UP504]